MKRDLFTKMSSITREFKPRTWMVEDVDGSIISDKQLAIARWKQYCETLYCKEINVEEENICIESNKEPDVMYSEIKNAIKHLKNIKSPGIYGISGEMVTAMGEEGMHALHLICIAVWKTGEWPKDWTTSVLIPLHKIRIS